MDWPGEVHEASFLRRYKRFFADFQKPDGTLITAHCPNTGSMATCTAENARSWVTFHDDPKRKLAYSWQAIELADGWTGINTGLANRLVQEAIETGVVDELQGYPTLKREQRYGENSRIDFLLSAPDRADCYVEVKNVTLLLEPGLAGFPDAVTKRGTKHVQELAAVRRMGGRAVLFFCVQRASIERVTVAEAFDPEYAACLRAAVAEGLEVYAYRADFDQQGVRLTTQLPVVL
ncbi:DNA/RNA nuclease SfsA [Acanthopleuribacter pedis]|uniref:Sugar fermentation stimulation protein homolog n=1 Tax=Acanthopleuribacter pedis TaxID=442870 RepID=A0A8J7Q868_9BACT|nr:DNA/RNA nuclease SfsA [Acanthopleuribacter pedis]MBO1319194.1 DNA/RNA nuclease SfsA [Acanthopleuribacter pedis]